MWAGSKRSTRWPPLYKLHHMLWPRLSGIHLNLEQVKFLRQHGLFSTTERASTADMDVKALDPGGGSSTV